MSGYQEATPLQRARAQVWAHKHGYAMPPAGVSHEESQALWERRLADIVNYPVRMAVKAVLVEVPSRGDWVGIDMSVDWSKFRNANTMLAAHDRIGQIHR